MFRRSSRVSIQSTQLFQKPRHLFEHPLLSFAHAANVHLVDYADLVRSFGNLVDIVAHVAKLGKYLF